MKIRAVANGNIIDEDDGRATALIAAGIYEAVDDKKPARKPAPEKSTKVEPMTTEDMPPPIKKVK